MNLVRVLDDHSHYMSAKIKVLLLLSSYVEDLASHIDELSGKKTSQHMGGENYNPLESLYSVVPILAQICNDGNKGSNSGSAGNGSAGGGGSSSGGGGGGGGGAGGGGGGGTDADVIDRLLLERTVDLINQVVQARLLRLTSEKRRISKWVWALLILLAMSSFYGVLLIQGGSLVLNMAFCGITIVVMTSAFVVLTDMEQPFSGFVQIDTSMFLLIRRDIRVVLRSAHMEQLHSISKQGFGAASLTVSQHEVLEEHRRAGGGNMASIARVDVSKTISNAEQRLTLAEPPAPRQRRMSITDLLKSTVSGGDADGNGSSAGANGIGFKAQFAAPADLDEIGRRGAGGGATGVAVGDGNFLSQSVVNKMKQRRASLDGGAEARRERRPSLDLSSFGQGLATPASRP
jgi:hypothetical protein